MAIQQHPANVEMQVSAAFALEHIREDLTRTPGAIHQANLGSAVFGVITTAGLASGLLGLAITSENWIVKSLFIILGFATIVFVVILGVRYEKDRRVYKSVMQGIDKDIEDVQRSIARIAKEGYQLHPELVDSYFGTDQMQDKPLAPFVEWGYRLRPAWDD
jgi:RsiW-degrading membrane proteinase PrsW (M82 family)